tara:strand:+ start:601 stop:762 length:162 start_codon:yes stop_codon:yes gene_type:complete
MYTHCSGLLNPARAKSDAGLPDAGFSDSEQLFGYNAGNLTCWQKKRAGKFQPC